MFRSIRSFFQQIVGLPVEGSLKHKAFLVSSIYRSLDKTAAAFKVQSGLKCPTHCGACCFNSSVEATELEMLPLAFELVRLSKEDEWYQRADSADFDGRCVFYTSDNGSGQCHFYPYRPLVCRLFGYAGNGDKNGRFRLVTCGVIKKGQPQQTEDALEMVFNGKLFPPIMTDLVMRVSSVDPEMARESMPVNLAFKKAVERVSLNKKFLS